jgi:hypothetical protein
MMSISSSIELVKRTIKRHIFAAFFLLYILRILFQPQCCTFFTMQSLFAAILVFTTIVRGTPLSAPKACKEYHLPLSVTTLNLKWALPLIKSNEDMAAFNANWSRRDASSSFHPFTIPETPETAVYTISGTFCEPIGRGNEIVLLATHGAGYDRR